MALFGNLLGAGVSALGGLLGAQQTQGGQTRSSAGNELMTNQFQAFPGATPGLNIQGPSGSTAFADGGATQGLSPELAQQFGLFSQMAGLAGGDGSQFGPQSDLIRMLQTSLIGQRNQSRQGVESRRLSDLRNRARPFEDELRQQTRAQVFNQGRLGLGRRGTLTGLNANPELAALEEGLARADLARQESATQFSDTRRANNINETLGLLSSLAGLGTQGLQNQFGASQAALGALQPAFAQTQLGIQGRTPLDNLAITRNIQRTGSATDPSVAAQQRARGVESFFAGLGGGIADSSFGGGGGGGGFFTGQPSRFDPITGDPIN